MYKDILRSIAGIDVFPVFSLVVFLLVFTVVLVWTARLDRRRLAHLASLPLDDTHGHCATCTGECRNRKAAAR
jgi:hypothetical protein